MDASLPKLSETLRFPREYDVCQSCGNRATETWEETDDTRMPTSCYIRLCHACSDNLIPPHPRMYVYKKAGEVALGAMQTCKTCRWCMGLTCDSPRRLSKGGLGVGATDQRRYGGLVGRKKPPRHLHDPWNDRELYGPPVCGGHAPKIAQN